MEEKRKIDRVKYTAKSILVDCETEETYYVDVQNLSPLGMGITMAADTPDLVGKEVIIVAEYLIMHATISRMDKNEDGSFDTGIKATTFSNEVLEYLFEHIGSGK